MTSRPSPATPDDLLANVGLAVERAADRINAQRSATDAIDAKALGALAVDGAGIATLQLSPASSSIGGSEQH